MTTATEALTAALEEIGSEDGHSRFAHKSVAASLIATLAAAGFAIVPREPTEAMVAVGLETLNESGLLDYETDSNAHTIREIFAAMLAAALGRDGV